MRWRNKRKTLGQLVLDLTPLLDVVFILLIVVLSSVDDYSLIADQTYADAKQLEQTVRIEKEEYEGLNAALREQLQTYEQQYNYINAVAVYATPTQADRRHRILCVEVNGGEPREWHIYPGSETQVWQECKDYIEAALSDRSEVYTIFKVDNKKMLYRDYETIRAGLYESLDLPHKILTDCMEFNDD